MLGVIGAIGAIVGAVYTIPERMNRFLAFLDLEKHAQTDGWQQIKSLQALGVGGWNGVGLGKAISEVGRLPFLENDFIFPMIGGDLGLQFSLLVVFAFVLIMVAGVTIALHAPDRFGMLLGVGIVGLIVFQAIIHIAVTTGSMPNTGLPLPFVSQGGSNLVVCLAGIGLLLSIHRRAWMEPEFVQPQLRMNLRITPRV
jgi:cell division protein FtsW